MGVVLRPKGGANVQTSEEVLDHVIGLLQVAKEFDEHHELLQQVGYIIYILPIACSISFAARCGCGTRWISVPP